MAEIVFFHMGETSGEGNMAEIVFFYVGET